MKTLPSYFDRFAVALVAAVVVVVVPGQEQRGQGQAPTSPPGPREVPARTHRKLRQAGVEAQLHVFEGLSHGQYNRDTPEGKEAYEEIAKFFNAHLGR